MYSNLKLKYVAENNTNMFITIFNYFICFCIGFFSVFVFLYLSYKDIIFPSLYITNIHLNNIFVFSLKMFVNVMASILCFSRISNWITIKNYRHLKETGTKSIGEIVAVREEKVGLFLFKCKAVVATDKGRTIVVDGIVRDKNFIKIYETHGPNSIVTDNRPKLLVDIYTEGMFDNYVDFKSINIQ